MEENKVIISISALRRISHYLNYLKVKEKEGVEKISSPVIARDFNLNEVLVRKDIAIVTGGTGKPKTGRSIHELINEIENFLGYNNPSKAVLVGTGHLGKAFLNFEGFEEYGLNIVLAFDNNPLVIGRVINNIKVCDIDNLESLVSRMGISIAIITTPKEIAQEICDRLIKAGVKGIWNFASIPLICPNDVIVQNENLATSLAVLSRKINEM